ncbi:MAG: GntR family transcriptional regulator [Desulfobacterales bacterium]
MFINQKSLREQVYDYIRDELSQGNLTPGMTIDLNMISRKLGISKTPLRDALLQLDTEGFVTISPRRGIFVNRLRLEDIRDCYEIIGALESTAILSVIDTIQPLHIEKMKILNRALKADLQQEDYTAYYQRNLLFHGVFLDLSHNIPLKRIILPLKQRLYDFPRRGYIKEWELRNCRDHDRLIDAFKKSDRKAAVAVWRDVHWSFTKQEKFIRRFYFSEGPQSTVSVAERRRGREASGKNPGPA